MPRCAADISLLYPEHAQLDRMAAAALQVQAPDAAPAAQFGCALDGARLQLVLMNAPRGRRESDCVLAALPGREIDFDHKGVDHVRIAGVPDRHEPDRGAIHYPAMFRAHDRLGYTGWAGCEYRPARDGAGCGTAAGLGWLRAL